MTAHVDIMPDSQRKQHVLAELKNIVQNLTGIKPEGMNVHASFFDVGVDSLMLIQATQAIQDQFAVKLSVVQLLEELDTLDAVATFLEQALPPDSAADERGDAQPAPPRANPETVSPPPRRAAETAPPAPDAAPSVALAPAFVPPPAARYEPPPAPAPQIEVTAVRADAEQSGVTTSVLEQLLAQQLQVMTQQLDLLRGTPAPVAPPSTPEARAVVPAAAVSAPSASPPALESAASATPRPATRGIEPELFTPYQPIQKGTTGGLTPRQQQHLDALVKSYTERTRESKRLTQEYRPYVADSRVSAGFRLLWKEMVYQLYAARSAGAKMWDVDGNEYVDVTMGFGLHLFGHSPDFVNEAIRRQLDEGTHLGPQIKLTGEVAKLICELTGLERVNFCNSGTEAVMGALRIARTVTRRNKIALFAGAYHGWADSTLARVVNKDGARSSLPVAPGVPPLAVEETLVLDWNDPRSLDTLREHAHELACLLVEPVQSRRPDIQPKEFLQELRRITSEAGVVLIVDEMVTGFRISPGGAQAWFDLDADLAIYGKVLGAGLPLGIVAGKAKFMDAFDGGAWNYGDASYPRAEKTLFAGAYFKHPLTMAVAHAILTRLRDEGEGLLAELNRRTTRLAETLDRYFAEQGVPARVVNYGSLFRVLFAHEYKFVDIFYYHLINNGVFIWEGRNCFLSTAHGDAEVDFIIEAVKQTVEQARAGGFLPDPPPAGPPGDDDRPSRSSGEPAAASPSSSSTPAAPPAPLAPSASSGPTGVATVAQPAVVNDRAAREPRRCDGGTKASAAGLQFSLYYFGNYPTEYYSSKYDLLLKGVKYADRHGFQAVWLPERHFNSYGGFSPNPSILAAALAVETEHIQLRGGSVVLPLHDPVRVAEDWAVIDNLSRGRVGISFASGWHPNDFVFAPDVYENRRDVMDEGIDIVRRLWRGESVERRNGGGDVIKVGLSARPAQSELPIWMTGASHGTGEKAGKLGAGILTNLQDQTIDELAAKLKTYRASLAEHGHDPATARATVLLHTYVVEDLGKALQDSRGPFREYLRSSMGLRSTLNRNQGPKIDLAKVSEADLEYFLSSGFERYKQVGTLIGTPDSCAVVVDRLVAAGVTEIGCLIDFGVPTADVLEGLHHLNALRERYRKRDDAERAESAAPDHRESLSLADDDDGSYSVALNETQQQFWVLTQLGDHVSRQYNESVTMRLRGDLNVEAMRSALREVVSRHDALRSTFSPTGETQLVHAAAGLDVPLIDFTHLAEGEREARATAWAREQGRKPFDLARGPVVRAAFARLDERFHLLLFATHHLVADGQAWGVMLADLRELYTAACEGRPHALPPPLKLGEQVRRQRAALSPEEDGRSEAFWLAQFADGFPFAELPTDRPRPVTPSHERKQAYELIDAGVSNELKALSKRERATLFVTLLAGYSLLLHQLTGRDDLVVGINVADPLSVRRKDAVGYRLQPQMLRSRLEGDPTFKEYLAAVKKRVYEAYEYQRFPAAKFYKSLNLKRDPRRAPLVAAGLNLDRADPPSTLHGLEVEFILDATSAPSLDIYLDIAELPEELSLKCNYNVDVFDAPTVARWMAHLRDLFAAIATEPTRRLSELPQFSTAAEAQREVAPEKVAPGAASDDEAGGATFDLTKFQRLLWAGQRLNPDEALYVNLGLAFIKQPLDPERLRAAFQSVIDRSDALRTVIEERDGVPRQRVLIALPYEMDFLDFSHEADPRARLESWARARRGVPLDMSRRMFDSALVKLADDEFAWHLNVHHVVADAWSFLLVYQHALDCYADSVAGRPARQPALPPFKDYLAYEAGLPLARKYREAEAYWKEKLAEPVEPPHFYGRPAVKRTTRSARVARSLGVERTRQLKAVAASPDLFIASEDATLSIIFAALTTGFLARVTGSRRLALGVPFNNRPTAAFQRTIGLFMQILPLRVAIDEDETFATLVKKLRIEFFESLRHHQYGVGNPIHQQAYDVECNYVTAQLSAPDGMPVHIEWPHSGHAHESLVLQVHDLVKSGDLTVTFDFHEDVFDAEQREQAINHFFRLIDAFIEDHARPLLSVSLLSAAEARRVLSEFNQTEAAFPLDETFAQLFEAQVARTPERVAVADDGQSLTYAQLNARANRLARRLRALGVAPGVVVPLLAQRGVDLLTSILAIFKAGGAYLPLDPLYPPPRLLQFLKQSRAGLLLKAGETHAELNAPLDELTARGGLRVVALEELSARAGDEGDAENLPPSAGPADLAYVIYTSGSTGVPKGAMLEQRGMVNHLFVKMADLGLTESDVVVQNASQSFDISVWQFLAALLVGGGVRVVNDEVARDAQQLLALLEAESVTVFETVPSLLRALLAHYDADAAARPQLPALRWLIVTGEALPPELCRRWLAAYPHIPMLNAYGPTECSDDVTHHVIDGPPGGDETTVPIGRPVANTQLYVLDESFAPVPVGMQGELCVGGAGVGRGYRDDAARTAAAFVPDPFAARPGARLYRTGDLARFRPDGALEFLGRIDNQVKIRGHRIELGEIEAVLSRQSGVAQVVVTARAEAGDDKRLVAYVVGREGEALNVNELRAALRDRLPEYMMPSAFVRLDALPLSPNGKVDLKSLPAPDPARPELDAAFVAPRGAAEEKLAEIFQQVLNVARVGAQDNYFELGGDSILSIQIASRATQAGLRLTPMMLFQHQTVAALASVVGTSAVTSAEQGAITGDVPLTPVQHWFFERELANPHHYNQALLLETRQPLDAELLRRGVRHLLRHHDMLSARFEPHGAGWRQYLQGADGDDVFSHHDLSGLPAAERRAALEAEAARLQAGLHLSAGPVARFALFDFGPDSPGRLLLVAHHLVVDGVSWRVLAEDLQTAYEQLSRGESVRLAPKTTSYKEWGERLAAFARSDELRQEQSYWLAAPRGALKPLPLDFEGGENLVTSASAVSVTLSAAETEALLKQTLTALDAQINDVLLTALAQSLARWTGGRAVYVNLESHGREELFPEVDLTRTVGWFTTMTPVLLDLGDAATAIEELASVQERLRLVPRKGIGYGVLRYLHEDARVRARLRASTATEISFNFLGQSDRALPESGYFKLATESAGPSMSRAGERGSVFDVNGLIVGGQLRFDWSYSQNLHRRETVESLARGFADALRAFINHQTADDFVAGLADFNWGHAEAADIAAALENLES
jgi:natural product biosynthesis luciferase-like monooxygenase protein/amino acid adenylation domain-containing protein/non-ribosomal peptide synthase protein (TIGR01720 family)